MRSANRFTLKLEFITSEMSSARPIGGPTGLVCVFSISLRINYCSYDFSMSNNQFIGQTILPSFNHFYDVTFWILHRFYQGFGAVVSWGIPSNKMHFRHRNIDCNTWSWDNMLDRRIFAPKILFFPVQDTRIEFDISACKWAVSPSAKSAIIPAERWKSMSVGNIFYGTGNTSLETSCFFPILHIGIRRLATKMAHSFREKGNHRSLSVKKWPESVRNSFKNDNNDCWRYFHGQETGTYLPCIF